MSDLITLRGMRFAGRHGVGAEERATPQPIEVDLARFAGGIRYWHSCGVTDDLPWKL